MRGIVQNLRNNHLREANKLFTIAIIESNFNSNNQNTWEYIHNQWVAIHADTFTINGLGLWNLWERKEKEGESKFYQWNQTHLRDQTHKALEIKPV